ncbi:MAG: DUF1538 domain-containing protein, partial [Elusimicrobia bacterium]|nr:DUF1538 domain-containing protein [Elusimicrobiota bacterium]
MNARDIKLKKNKVGFKEALRLIVRYSRKRIYEQIKAISFITIYLFLFQVLILRLPVLEGGLIALGLVFTVIGLAIFMEGLMLGIMPLGERVGVKLPQKSKLPTILLFAFILGLLSTFAEPSVNILKTIGGSTVAWKAPLLFMLLNARAQLLVSAVGIGVGFAVVMGLLRVIYGWSLKPFIYSLISILSLLTLYVYLDPNLQYLLGLAWDSGAITTGVVTVPLVIALGIGASQVTGKRIGDYGVFGIITLAGLTPVIAVLIFGIMQLPNA